MSKSRKRKTIVALVAKVSAGVLVVDLRTTASKPETSSSGLYHVYEDSS